MPSAETSFDERALGAPVTLPAAGFVVEWQMASVALDGAGRTLPPVSVPRPAPRPRVHRHSITPPQPLVAEPVTPVEDDRVDRQGDRSAVFDAAQTIRAFGAMFAAIPDRFGNLDSEVQRWRGRPASRSWSALQHAAHFADLLASVAADLSHLLNGQAPAAFQLGIGPKSESNRLDPDVVLTVLAGDAERVARLLESWPTVGDPDGIGYGAMVVALAEKAIGEGMRTLGLAQDAFAKSTRLTTQAPDEG